MDYLNLTVPTKGLPRFDTSRFVAYREDYFDPVNSVLIQELTNLPVIGTYKILDVPYRPDMISYDVYRDCQYWWLLMLYNNEIFLEKLEIGRKLNYFSLADLDAFFYSLARRRLPSPIRLV